MISGGGGGGVNLGNLWAGLGFLEKFAVDIFQFSQIHLIWGICG